MPDEEKSYIGICEECDYSKKVKDVRVNVGYFRETKTLCRSCYNNIIRKEKIRNFFNNEFVIICIFVGIVLIFMIPLFFDCVK